jgi:diguanylate cyclase (GGDEF)-like protein
VAFCDLDHFKRLNDTHGHEAGDRALRCFARLIRGAVRDTDVVCRYGGEEFVVVFPDTDAAQAVPVMERLSRELENAVLAGEVPELTVSVGVADWTTAAEPTEAIRQADGAMFRAKQRGRDQIVRAQLDRGLPVEEALSGAAR